MNELISVIVPIYNVEKYLKQCLESIIIQTYENIEILLINDGSTDNSGNICNEFEKRDDRVKVIHKENSGPSETRNYGIEKSKGKYITFIDADDFVSKDYIKNLYNLLKENKCDISATNRYDVWNHGNTKIEKCEFYNNLSNTKIFDSEEYLIEILKNRLAHEIWGKLYKSELLRKNKLNKEFVMGEDLEYLIRILAYSNLKIVCNTNICDYYYRRRDNSIMSGKYDKSWEKEIKFYIELCNSKEYIKYQKYIKNLLANSALRSFKRLVTQEDSFNNYNIQFIVNSIKNVKITDCDGKKNKIKILLLKYFPYLFWKILKTKEILL